MEVLKIFAYVSIITVSITWSAVGIITLSKLSTLDRVKDQTVKKVDDSMDTLKEASDKITDTFDKASKAMSNIFKGI